MKKKVLYLGAILIVLISINSCDLEELTNLVSLTDISDAMPTIEENMEVQAKIIDVFENVNNLIDVSDMKSLYLRGDGPKITADGNTYTFDYTEVPNSSGIIVVAFSGEPSWLTPELKATITFNDYESDDYTINGGMELKVNPTLLGTINYTLKTINSLTIINIDDTFTWSCDYLIKWTEGLLTTNDSSDNTYLMSGSSTQVKDGDTNILEIIEDLLLEYSCEYIKQGVIKVTINSGDDSLELSVDFGVDADGNNSNDCDSNAIISSGGLSLPVEF